MANVSLRRAEPGDLPAIIELLAASMSHAPTGTYRSFFEWKHHHNAFGASPTWVAVDGDRIVGLRTFLRWEFSDGGRNVRAVRAVDTATHPEYQGRGIFAKLTTAALHDLRSDGVELIFNTPNDKSRPGYLKMGWSEVGRIGTRVRIQRVTALPRIATSRVAANIWSEPTELGVAPSVVLDNEESLTSLLSTLAPGSGLSTALSSAFLRWRFGFEPLHYRAVVAEGGLRNGVAFFRRRTRGASLEAAILHVVVANNDPKAYRSLLRRVAREAGGDYAIVLESSKTGRSWLPLNVGPVLTALALNGSDVPPLRHWDLNLADIELF